MIRKKSAILVLLLLAAVAWHGREVPRTWREARGWEPEWIARNLAQGQGYSFQCAGKWLGPPSGHGQFCATAWVAPTYTGVMALLFALFGEPARLALVFLNLAGFALSCLLVFILGRDLAAPWAGVAGAALLLAAPLFQPVRWTLTHYIGPSTAAPALLLLSAGFVLRCLEHPSVRRGLAAGAATGLLALTLGSTGLAIPVAALAVAAESRPRRRAWRAAAALLMGATLLVVPWTLRNLLTFRELVPVRTGAGFSLHFAIPALARTYRPEIDLGVAAGPPPWTARSAFEAVERVRVRDREGELAGYSSSIVEANAPSGYDHLNEAQRDAVYRAQALGFAFRHPGVTLELAGAKAWAFVAQSKPLGSIAALAAIGLLVGARDRRVRCIAALAAACVVPYLLAAPLYYRYRFPVEPLLCLLAGILLARVLSSLGRRRREDRVDVRATTRAMRKAGRKLRDRWRAPLIGGLRPPPRPGRRAPGDAKRPARSGRPGRRAA